MLDARHQEALRVAEEIGQFQKLADLASHVEAQLRITDAFSPILAILSRAQDEAADALSRLATAPVDRPDVIRGLQNSVWRYETLVRWLREIIAEGNDAHEKIAEHRAQYFDRLVGDHELDDETRRALSLPETQAPTE